MWLDLQTVVSCLLGAGIQSKAPWLGLLRVEPSVQPHERVINSSKVWMVDPKFFFNIALTMEKKNMRLIALEPNILGG